MSQGEKNGRLRQRPQMTFLVLLRKTLAQQMNRKNSSVVTRRIFYAQNGQQMRLWLGLRPDAALGAYSAPPDLAGLTGPTQ